MYEYRVRAVKKVIDGDTFDLELDLGFYQYGVYRCRLLGVDTPELRPRKGTEEERADEKRRAALAAAFVRDWFADRLANDVKILARTQKSDSFGRWLAEIEAELSLADAIIEKGLGKPYGR